MFYRFTEREVGRNPKLPVGPGNPAEHREPTGTTGPAMELERLARERKLGNVSVVREDSKVGHAEVPRAYLADLLKAAAYLDERWRRGGQPTAGSSRSAACINVQYMIHYYCLLTHTWYDKCNPRLSHLCRFRSNAP